MHPVGLDGLLPDVVGDHRGVRILGQHQGARMRRGERSTATWLWLSKPFWDPILVGRCTTHFLFYFVIVFLLGIGMFTGGTIWILTHGHVARWNCGFLRLQIPSPRLERLLDKLGSLGTRHPNQTERQLENALLAASFARWACLGRELLPFLELLGMNEK